MHAGPRHALPALLSPVVGAFRAAYRFCIDGTDADADADPDSCFEALDRLPAP